MNFINKYIKRIGLYALLMGSATACYVDPTTVTPLTAPNPPAVPTSGTANFGKYVAIGNSLTAGFADGGVYRAGQLVAYPNIIAQQFRRAGGGDFIQPLYTEAQKDGTGYLVLRNNPIVASPIIQPFGPTSAGFMGGIVGVNGTTPLYAKYVGANNNFGVPGIRIADVLTPGYGFSNPVAFNNHFERLLGTTNATSNYKDYVLANSTGATFFSMWLGNNDILGYATAGGVGAMTDATTFTTNYKSMLDGITNIASQGVLVTIPNVTLAPHFNIPGLNLSGLLATINASLPVGTPAVTSIFIEASGGNRAATATDIFFLGAQADYGNLGKTNVGAGQPFPYGLHPNNPLRDGSVLDPIEVTEIQTQTTALNAIITAEATARNLAILDVNATGGVLDLASKTAGYQSPQHPGIVYRTAFISGGIFSLDGIHLTPAGNALIANEIIKVVNAKYSSTVPLVDPRTYRTVVITPAP